MKKNVQCESDKKSCQNELEDKAEKNRELRQQNSEYLKSIEELRSTSSANQKLARECQDKLEDEVNENKILQNKFEDEMEEKEILQLKYESVCPSWSEWSDCSKTCWGIKTRMDRCSMEDEQINSCNQDSSCARSGKFTK